MEGIDLFMVFGKLQNLLIAFGLDAVWSFLLRSLNTISAIVMTLVVARKFGAEISGQFFLCLTLITLAQHLCRLGMDNVVVRNVAAAEGLGGISEVERTVNSLAVVIFLIGMVTAIAVTGCSQWISESIFRKPELTAHLRIIPWAIPFLSVSFFLGYAFQGQRKLLPMILSQNLFLNLAFVFVLWSFTSIQGGTVSRVFVACSALTCLLAICLWKAGGAAFGFQKMSAIWVTLCKGISFFHVVIMQQFMAWLPVILVGAFASSSEVAIFLSANRVASLSSFLLMSVNTILGPRFSSLFSKGNLSEIERTIRNYAKLTSVLSLPLIFVVLVCPGWIMGLFGPDFIPGSRTLQILCLGQIINLFTGSVGLLLMMTHNERTWRKIVLGGFISSVVLSVVLIPIFHGAGAAAAVSISLSLQMILGSVAVWRRFGIVSTPILPSRN